MIRSLMFDERRLFSLFSLVESDDEDEEDEDVID